jgi:phosphate transport system substrate-binding protein
MSQFMLMKNSLKSSVPCCLFVGILAIAVSQGLNAVSVRAAEPSTIAIDGSSTVYPVTEAVAEEFQKVTKGAVRVTVGISGTGGGFKKFVRGETDIQDASRPILTAEMEQAKANKIDYIELPIVFDALTVAINPKNTWVDYLTVEELKKLWEPAAQGTVMTWKQIRSSWPDEKIELFGAGSDSGTFDYFTEAIVGKAKSSRGDYTGSEDDNVLIQGIEGNVNALGYIPFAYYAPNMRRLKAVSIQYDKNVVKEPVLPSKENVLKGIYNPLARPLFIYINAKSVKEKPAVKKFVEFFIENAEAIATQVKYLPLAESDYEKVMERFESIKLGTAFGGVPEVGVKVEDILSREPRN